jgi:hypothetical protein
MWALLFILLYGTFVVCVESWAQSRADARRRAKR